MSDTGLFITIEGCEGVGKSTNISYLQSLLSNQGIDVMVTREPGGTALGEDIRNALLAVRGQRVNPLAELLLIFAARAQHLSEVVEPALASGRWVLCDRFTDATYAYQGGGRGLNTEVVAQLETMVQGQRRPDRTILLDVDVSVGLARARGRGDLDRIEQETVHFFERVREVYRERAACEPERFSVIDAGQTLEQVQQALTQLVQQLLAQSAAGTAP
ncbi:MAG: dTMP kinase [Halioglobus sp.]